MSVSPANCPSRSPVHITTEIVSNLLGLATSSSVGSTPPINNNQVYYYLNENIMFYVIRSYKLSRRNKRVLRSLTAEPIDLTSHAWFISAVFNWETFHHCHWVNSLKSGCVHSILFYTSPLSSLLYSHKDCPVLVRETNCTVDSIRLPSTLPILWHTGIKK